MKMQTLVVGPLQVNCHIVGCGQSGRAAVIDPGDEGGRILQALEAAGLTLETIINTHGHFDHIGANRALMEETGAELLIHQADLPVLHRAAEHAAGYGLPAVPSPEPTRTVADGEVIEVGDLVLSVIHTPGHSPGGICLSAPGHLFSGDALFAGSIGRTDLPGGDHETLVAGIRSRLLSLPDSTAVHPGHGPDTTIAREKATNPFL